MMTHGIYRDPRSTVRRDVTGLVGGDGHCTDVCGSPVTLCEDVEHSNVPCVLRGALVTRHTR